MLRPTAAKKGGKLYCEVVEVADCFIARWYRDVAESCWRRHGAEDARSDETIKGEGGQPCGY